MVHVGPDGNPPVTDGFPLQSGVSKAEIISMYWRYHA